MEIVDIAKKPERGSLFTTDGKEIPTSYSKKAFPIDVSKGPKKFTID